MRVTYPELIAHTKKALEACFIPYGCIDDGAELTAWSEMMGLGGLNDLYTQLNRIENFTTPLLSIENDEKIDGKGNSGLIISRLMFDEIMSVASPIHGTPLSVINCTSSLSMMENVVRAARHGYYAEIYVPGNYPVIHAMAAYSKRDIFAYHLSSKERADHLLQQRISCLLNIVERHSGLEANVARKLEEADEVYLTPAIINKAEKSADENGVEVDAWLWNKIGEKGREILVDE